VSGINAIIGLPDSGKTNVIRSIAWCLTNRPLGFKFHSDFTDDPTSVSIKFDDQQNAITLAKTKTKSSYRFGDEELKAIGADVPDVVQRAANMSELNIQKQLDKPYLICDSPGEVAKTFNRITRLEKPDQAVSFLTTDINSENKRLKQIRMHKDSVSEDLKALGDVEGMKRDCDSLVKLQDSAWAIDDECVGLDAAIEGVTGAQKRLQSFGDMTKMKSDLCQITTDSEDLGELVASIGSLSNLVFEIKYSRTFITNTENELQTMNSRLSSLEEWFDNMVAVRVESDNLYEFVCKLVLTEENRANAWDEFIKKAKEYRKFLNTITICPYCSQCSAPVSKHNLDGLLKGFDL
jgi:hypothetical protein